MSHLFLSYSHADSAMAERLAQGLQARGHALWYDRQLQPGQRWLQRLSRAARDCAALLLLMSPAAEASPWVEMELCIALRYGRPVLPLALQGHQFDALAHVQHLDFDGEITRQLLDSLPPSTRAPAAVSGGIPPQVLLSDEERQICLGVAAGRSYRDIGAALDLSGRTVRRRVSALRSRLTGGRG
ncbi:MAG: TIR domain-containing protein [Anaerolineaceae bacterium]|nr:TIR domain-containing protein [Anaerolineaceae bacterium]